MKIGDKERDFYVTTIMIISIFVYSFIHTYRLDLQYIIIIKNFFSCNKMKFTVLWIYKHSSICETKLGYFELIHTFAIFKRFCTELIKNNARYFIVP